MLVPLAAVGTSQVLQIVAAVFGTAGNLAYGTIDFGVAAWITLFELAGVVALDGRPIALEHGRYRPYWYEGGREAFRTWLTGSSQCSAASFGRCIPWMTAGSSRWPT